VIDTIRIVAFDCLLVIGGAVLLAAILRFGGAALDAIPMSRARRLLLARLRPLAGATLIAVFLVMAARWVLASDDRRAWIALALIAAVATAASWASLRDLLEGVYLRAGRSFAVGDRVQIGEVRGRVQRLGHRAVTLETADGELALIPYRTVATATIRREPNGGQPGLHVFRMAVPDHRSITEVKRAVREAALLCHWSSISRPPEVSAADDGQVEITVFPVDGDHVADLERTVRRALIAGAGEARTARRDN
jgi:small-conductance mechanosensitive channel